MRVELLNVSSAKTKDIEDVKKEVLRLHETCYLHVTKKGTMAEHLTIEMRDLIASFNADLDN